MDNCTIDDEIVHHLLTLQGQFKSPKQMVCRPCLWFALQPRNVSHSERGNHIRYQLRIRGRSNGLSDWCHQPNPLLHFPYSLQTFYNLLWLSEADPTTWILLKIFHVYLLLCFILYKLHSQTQAVHLWHPNCTGNDVTIVMPSANI